MSIRRPAAALLGLLGAGAVAGLAWLWPRLVWGEVEPAWADPLPENAVEQGYASFYRWRGGPAWPAWEEGWLERDPPRADGPLLVDTRHTSKQPWDADIAMDAFGYSQMHGFARAFRPIHAAGVAVEPLGRAWSGRRLGGASAMFVNLPSGDNAPFTTAEVVAMEAFVRLGGGLVLVVDHSNCYFHAEMLAPLTKALGITLPPVTATDSRLRLTPRTVSWMRVETVLDHPVTAGVRRFGMLTAAAIEGLEPLATTSAGGWYDRWEPYLKADSSGLTGNLKRDPDERPGPAPVVAAGTHGAGRVVVLGDQNAWGATLIGYEDNARLFTQAIAWATGRDIPAPARGADTVTTVVADGVPDCVSVGTAGYRTFQVQLQRWAARTGKEEGCTAGSPGASGAVVILPQPARDDLATLLAAPRVLAVLDPAAGITDPLLAALGLSRVEGPEGAAADGVPVEPDAPAAEPVPWEGATEDEDVLAAPPPKGKPARWVIERPAPDVPALRVGDDAITALPMEIRGPFDGFDVWMLDDDGRPVVVALKRDGRRVILVLDAALLQNGALGKERDDPRKKLAEGASNRRIAAHRLAHRLAAELFAD